MIAPIAVDEQVGERHPLAPEAQPVQECQAANLLRTGVGLHAVQFHTRPEPVGEYRFAVGTGHLAWCCQGAVT